MAEPAFKDEDVSPPNDSSNGIASVIEMDRSSSCSKTDGTADETTESRRHTNYRNRRRGTVHQSLTTQATEAFDQQVFELTSSDADGGIPLVDDSTGSERRAGVYSRSRQDNIRESLASSLVPGAFDRSSSEILEQVLLKERLLDWIHGFRRKDPRYRLHKFFEDVAREGADKVETHGIRSEAEISPLLRSFQKAAVFSVWRPTSYAAIRRLMTGDAVGKGLDVKGKSALGDGKLSGFVPFLQIHKEEHKRLVGTLSKSHSIRIFYQDKKMRDAIMRRFQRVEKEMRRGCTEARKILADDADDEDRRKQAMLCCCKWDMTNAEVASIDDYGDENTFGLEVPERLFWETYVMRQDITKRCGTDLDINRGSRPEFQDMNFKSLRYPKTDQPRPVLWQANADNPLCPFSLLVAYEENSRVKPVVSDFDCFLVGTRGIRYEDPLPDDQLEQLLWCIDGIGEVLEAPGSKLWTSRWLELLKQLKTISCTLPKYGYADPKSYAIMKHAVERMKSDGCVRHGSESFNYIFPQTLDNEYLVIDSDTSPGRVNWHYVDEEGLREILKTKIDEGFTFPLNPKWILCDPGWKEIYDKLLLSQMKNVPESTEVWFPPKVRTRIEEIYKRNPDGFPNLDPANVVQKPLDEDARAAAALAELQFDRYRALRRGIVKLKCYLRLFRYDLKRKGANAETKESIRQHANELVKLVARSETTSSIRGRTRSPKRS